jgi:hypothetical protein
VTRSSARPQRRRHAEEARLGIAPGMKGKVVEDDEEIEDE